MVATRYLLKVCGRAICAGALGLLFSAASVAGRPAASLGGPPVYQADPPQSLRILCYHDVRDHLKATIARSPDPTAVDTDEFVNHLAWLRENGFHPVSLDDFLAAREGRKPLPDKAILLTFDDGYHSVYTRVFPVLKLFHFPAVVGLVGSWLEVPAGTQVDMSGTKVPRDNFVTWSEVREMQASGLVEIASHSYDLHHGIQGNPQNNLEPAAVTRAYDPGTARYEDDSAYIKRVRSDLEHNAALIQRETGRRPRVMVWPYGAYNQTALRIARELGMPITLNLQPGPNPAAQPLAQLRRALVEFDHDTPELTESLRAPAEQGGEIAPRMRVIQVDLDYVYDPDPQRQETNLSRLIERVNRYGINTVFLQAFADPDGKGVAEAVYFPNRHLPMRADLFNRAAWQLRTRAKVKVYAWMPVLAFKPPGSATPPVARVQAVDEAPASTLQDRPQRLSPFDPEARQLILDIYEDLAKSSPFAGVLFHDDAVLGDDEDASDPALRVYAQEWGLPRSIAAIRADPALMRIWSHKKSEALIAFTHELAGKLREYQPALMTARNIFARPILEPEAESRFAQNYTRFLSEYDYTVLMAMPFMENAGSPQSWLRELERRVAETPNGLARTVFELQSKDWRTHTPVPDEALIRQIRLLHSGGAVHLGYYPDDFLRDAPSLAHLRPELSLESNPAPDHKLTN